MHVYQVGCVARLSEPGIELSLHLYSIRKITSIMLEPFHVTSLLLPATVVFAATIIATYAACTNAMLSVVAAAIKAGIFVVYFGFLFDGTYTVLDDVSYVQWGTQLREQGVGLFNFYLHWPLLRATFGTDTVFYYVYNSFAFSLFDTNQYFAPVALNLVLTAVIAFLGYRLVKTEFRINDLAAKVFFFFLLFHPDILVWSNLLNIKDILVLFIHVLLLTALAQFFKHKVLSGILILVPVIPVILLSRYYVLGLFVAALVSSILISTRNYRIWMATAVGCAIILLLIYLTKGASAFTFPIHLIKQTFVNPFYGFARFLLTPIPFNTEEAYTFLNIPAVIHWLLMPLLMLGMYKSWVMGTHFSRFLVVYFFVFLCAYAVTGEVQGPRHRVQLDFAIAAFQFIGILTAYQWLQVRRIAAKAYSSP
jgi:hypothetical protein